MRMHTYRLKNWGKKDDEEEEECVRNHVVRARKANDIVRFSFPDLLSLSLSGKCCVSMKLEPRYINGYVIIHTHTRMGAWGKVSSEIASFLLLKDKDD